MKNPFLHKCFAIYFVFIFFILVSILGNSCSENSTESKSGTAQGTLSLPFEAAGKMWGVLIDTDLDGDNGYTKLVTGTCGSGTNIPYSISGVPTGTYFIYAVVFVVSDGSQGPQAGDLYGIYGGEFPNNMPTNPNAKISTGTQTFDIDLVTFGGEIPQTAIIAHWNFDEMSGTVLNDQSIYNNDGTIVNAQWVTGYSGGALQFQDNCYVNVTYNSILQPTLRITIEAIVKFSRFDVDQAIVSTNENGGYGLWIYQTMPNIFININSIYASASAPSGNLNFNDWYHLAGVYDGSALKFYINGDLKESLPFAGPIIYQYQNALKIGSDASATNAPDTDFFHGSIDEIRITGMALQPDQFLSF
ncbi:LamG domain-containing protein [Calditrichota bacterium]